MIAVTRLHLRNVNIASTTALQALAPNGRELGLLAGANVIMPNIGDLAYRKGYLLYENKPGTDENAGHGARKARTAVAAIGESIAYGEWGIRRISRPAPEGERANENLVPGYLYSAA